jgi:serine/threonine-protein phosphatase 5
LFSEKHYKEAIELYSKAIQLLPTEAIYWGNRSFAYLRTEMFGSALSDATKAIDLNPKYVKGYYRRAGAYMALSKFKLALRDLETVRSSSSLTHS